MRGLSATQILLLAAVAVSPCWSQTPTITTIQASFVGGQPADVGGITSGMTLQGGFTLYINGTFNPNAFINATWHNPSTNFTTVFTAAAATVTPTRVILPIPNTLFQTPVTSPVKVVLTVLEQGGSTTSSFPDQPSVDGGSADPSGGHSDRALQRELHQRRHRALPGIDDHRSTSGLESQRHCDYGNSIADRRFQFPNLRLGLLGQ